MKPLHIQILVLALFLYTRIYCQDTSNVLKPVNYQKNYLAINMISLVFNTQPNINYERFLTKRFSVVGSLAYKGKEWFTLNGGRVVYYFKGPRESVAFRFYFNGNFIGVKAGYSALRIDDITVYSSASSYAGYYTHFYAKRLDTDLGICLGRILGEINKPFRAVINFNMGIRKVQGETTFLSHKSGDISVGGFVMGYSSPILNGTATVPFFEVGFTIGGMF